MAKANAHANDESNSYSGFERFLFFLTPIVFTAVLLGALLLLFNEDWRNKALEAGNKVPILKAVLPDPASQAPAGTSDEELTVASARQRVEELEALLADREASLKQATQQAAEQQKEIEALKAQVDQLNQDKQQAEISEEEYTARINSLADVYAKMTPGKAAPILESMAIEETALILGAMQDTQRTRVLERMTPQKAADVSMKLKDSETVKDRQIAALQARIKELEAKEAAGSSTLDLSELRNTFSSMNPSDAAGLLLQMAASDQAKTLLVLSAMDDNARSQVLAAMSKQDSKTAAALVGKLLPSNS